MTPRPHLAFRGRFGFHTSLGFAGLGKGGGRRPEPAAGRPSGDGPAAFRPGGTGGLTRLSAIVAGEVLVVLALAVMVVRGTGSPRQSSVTLLAAFLAMLILAYLRRKTVPGDPAL